MTHGKSHQLASLALILGLLALNAAVAQSDSINRDGYIEATIIPCRAQESTTGARVEFIDEAKTPTELERPQFEQLSLHGDAAFLRAKLPASTYDTIVFWGQCNGRADITVLPGYSRRVVLALSSTCCLIDSEHGSLAGTLPFAGLTVSVAACQGPQCSATSSDDSGSPSRQGIVYPATVDGRAYYANGLPPGFWTLVVSDATGRVVRIPVGEGSLRLHRILNISKGRLLYYFKFE